MNETIEKSIKLLHKHTQIRAKYANENEVEMLNGIIKNFVDLYNSVSNEQSSINKDILQLVDKVKKLETIGQLMGLTKEGVYDLMKLPTWFLDQQLDKRKKTGLPVNNGKDFCRMELNFAYTYDCIKNDASIIGLYMQNLLKFKNNDFTRELEEHNPHLMSIFHQVKHASEIYTENELLNEIEEIYARA